jgi:HAD superfamily hydrolase (TIGR01509 family)
MTDGTSRDASGRPQAPTRKITAAIFDLDGLLVDSETPEYLAWKAVYARYGLEFPLASWLPNIGRNDGPFDPLGPFRQRNTPASPEEVATSWREERDALLRRDFLRPLPGVLPLLTVLRKAVLRTAVASSSRAPRVRYLIESLGLGAQFDAMAAGDEVSHGKPAPDVYLLAARRLGTPPEACVTFEDSTNGARAAKAAGMLCVVVPSALTRAMDFSAADLVVDSLEAVTLDLIASLAGAPGA